MYKDIEVLNKEKFKTTKFADIKSIEVAKSVGVVPLGFSEVLDMSYFAPVVIMGEEKGEFVAFTGISTKVTIFNNDSVYIPRFVKTYPFVNMNVKDEQNNLKSVIGIDNGIHVSKRKKQSIFNKKGELLKAANSKIEILMDLNIQRDVSRKIIQELKAHDLLIQKDFKVKYEEEERIILEKFYIINRDKLINLDDKVLATWAKKGWMSIIDCHIKSLGNFEKVLISGK